MTGQIAWQIRSAR